MIVKKRRHIRNEHHRFGWTSSNMSQTFFEKMSFFLDISIYAYVFFNIFFTCCRKMDADRQKYFILLISALNFVKDTQARL